MNNTQFYIGRRDTQKESRKERIKYVTGENERWLMKKKEMVMIYFKKEEEK